MTHRSTLAIALLAAACATTGADGQGNLGLPTAGVGPFRKLIETEVPGIAPFVFEDPVALYRDPGAIAVGADVWLYAVATRDGKDVLVRSRATDARSFYGTSVDGRVPPLVLAADQPWEGGALSGPAIVRRGSEYLLYYAGAEGIGVARSSDGLAFTKEPGVVLAAGGGAWETTPPRSPGPVVMPDGQVRLFYTAGDAIGEASSDDGVHFTRVDPLPATPEPEPVLGPAPPAPPGSLLPNEKPPFDTARVADPSVLLRTTPAGRLHVRVLYRGETADGASTIGFAARYGEAGPLERQPVPVYSVGQHERAPTFVELPYGTMLYVEQDRRVDADTTYPGISAAFAPASDVLGLPGDFPDAP